MLVNANSNSDAIRKQSIPMIASVNWAIDADDYETRLKWFEKFYLLSRDIRSGLNNDKVQAAILDFSKHYNVYTTEKIGEVSRIVRGVFTDNLREGEIIRRIKENLEITSDRVEEAFYDVKNICYLVKEEGKKSLLEYEELVFLKKALKQNNQIGEQEIGNFEIKLELLNDLVKPSIKNWIEDYIEQKGLESHTAMERSDFLFKSRNAKRLSSEDRDKLSLVLKAYDENGEVYLSKKDGTIVFQAVEEVKTPVVQPSLKKENVNAPIINKRLVAQSRTIEPLKQPIAKPQPVVMNKMKREDGNMKIKSFTQGNETAMVSPMKKEMPKPGMNANQKAQAIVSVPPTTPVKPPVSPVGDAYFKTKPVKNPIKLQSGDAKSAGVNVIDLKEYL